MDPLHTPFMNPELVPLAPVKRIVSLVPSQTELLYDLGLGDEVVGITKFCVHPESWFRSKKRVGGTKTVHVDVVSSLKPDLILANKEENTREQVEALAAAYPVWMSDIKTVADGLKMIADVGAIVGKSDAATAIASKIERGLGQIAAQSKPCRVAYFIWRKPWICAGGDTFISDLIAHMGWHNVLADFDRYPEVTLEMLKDRKVDKVLLSSEPYPFKDEHIAEIEAVLPNTAVQLVDGEMFSWYGSRMVKAVDYLAALAAK